MKVRNLCAVLGIALAVGVVVFMRGLVAANDRQALARAERLLEQVKVPADAKVCTMTVDYRPGGRVLQGPPMMAVVATGERQDLAPDECVATELFFAQRHLPVPKLGTELVLVGRKGTYRLKLVALLPADSAIKPVRGYPNLFVTPAAAATIGERWRTWEPKTAAEIAPSQTSDAERNLNRAKPLLLWAAALTALCLLVNTLLLAIEAKRKEIAMLRMVGMTRGQVVVRVFLRSLQLTVIGDVLGLAVASVALWFYVRFDPVTFPMGIGPLNPLAWELDNRIFAASIGVALMATLLALRPALKVRPLEAASNRMPRKRPLGMLIAFACGFGAFVAVEVWGASLMSAFVPSPEWPDAIVSILPGGISPREVAAIGKLPGVKWWRPLVAKQLGTRERNVLLIGSEPTARLPFPTATNECYITAMMARARQLQVGDMIEGYRIARILDLNWHMVTSRGLLRGRDERHFDQRTDGPLLVAPWPVQRYTHLWLDYEPNTINAVSGLQFEGNTMRVHARDEIADGTFAHGDEIVGAMARIPFLFLIVISLGFVAMLVASAQARRREFVVLRAVGATRGQLAWELAREALKVALGGIGFGLVFGALAGWLFAIGTRAAMAHWGIPPNFAVPVLPIVKGALGAVFFALAIAVPTAIVAGKAHRRA